jgi:HTH-type transcriptional regulator, competence development regulator
MTVGMRIKELRKILKLTQKDFSEKINVSPQVVSNWEREYTKPNSEDISRIAKALDVNTEFLYGRTNDPSPVISKKQDEIFDSLAEITKLAKKHGLDQLGFFDIEEWKNLSPEEIKMLDAQFRVVAQLAKKRNEDK